MPPKTKHLGFPDTNFSSKNFFQSLKSIKNDYLSPLNWQNPPDKIKCCQRCRQRRAPTHWLIKAVNW